LDKPDKFRITATIAVQIATIAAFAKTVIFLLQKRHDDKKASTAARITATSPP
jgi:mevalonate pyrophosphate decarboxylase